MKWFSRRRGSALALILVAVTVGMTSSSGLAGERKPPKKSVPTAPVTVPVLKTGQLPAIGDPRGSTNSGATVVIKKDVSSKAEAVVTSTLAETVTTASSDITASITSISATVCAKPELELKLLVISADGTETTLPAIRQALDFLGTPYTVWVARQRPGALTADVLAGGADGCRGFYQGVILATGALSYSPDGGTTWASALNDDEWQTLTTYEANLSVRRVSWYTYPTAGYGYAPPTGAFDTTSTPINATYTTAAASIFGYANRANPLPIKGSWTYLAQPLDASTTALLTDGAGNALVALRAYPDGRQAISVTTAGSPYLTHSLVLSYGLVNWATRGVFLGQRRSALSPQIDDIMAEGDIWVGSPCETCAFFRMSGADFANTVAWQAAWKAASPQTAGLRLDFAFNGEGSTGIYVPDTLTAAIIKDEYDFRWINHTFTHQNLDAITYADAMTELQKNHNVAKDIGLTAYSKQNLVTPEISGLANPEFLRAAKAFGIRNVVTDTSRPGHDNPTPNTGLFNALEPSIFMIPRHPVNLFYNVTTPAEWVDEYNYLYRVFWGRDLSFAEIVDKESDNMLFYMLRWDIDPLMFHQGNLRAYDGKRFLLGDLMEAVFAKYSRLFTIPFTSFAMETISSRMQGRMKYNASGVTGSFTPGDKLTLTTANAATIPITGVRGPGLEMYGGQTIANVKLEAGATATLDIGAPTWPTGSTVTASAITQTTLTLTWSAAMDNVGVTAYRVLRNGAVVATVSGGVLTYSVSGLKANTSYTFRVQAMDAAGYVTNGPSTSAKTMP